MRKDGELLELLERAPERGMEEIVAQYTPLLCAVAARRVHDGEEVKDLVNETFLEFYAHRERFDPEKGSLRAYLSAITDRLAVKRYWELSRLNTVSADDMADERDCIESAELKNDLAAALEQLDPIDARIVREKYYGGMNFKEIAAALDLPYETVKKRHQRSLKKLLRTMSIGMLLAALAAILAACAWLVLRYFGIVPGYGVNTNADSPAYVLEETAVLETEDYTLTVEDGWWNDGLLMLEYTIEGALDTSPQSLTDYYGIESSLEGLEECRLLSSSSTLVDGGREEVVRCFRGELPGGSRGELKVTFTAAAQPLELTLCRAEETSYEQAGYFALTEAQGGLLAAPRRENGELIVSIYPLNEGDFAIDPGLTKLFGETAPVTVTAEDGTVLTGTPVDYRPYGSAQYFDWNFGPAGEGDYTLNVPYVYESLAAYATRAGVHDTAEPISFTLTVPEPEETVVELPFGSVTLTAGELLTDYDPLPQVDVPEILAMRSVYDRFTWQCVRAQWHCNDSAREIVSAGVMVKRGADIQVSVGETILSVETESLSLLPQSVTDAAGGMTVSRPGDLQLGYHESITEVTGQITPGSLYYRWDQPFSISFTVE